MCARAYGGEQIVFQVSKVGGLQDVYAVCCPWFMCVCSGGSDERLGIMTYYIQQLWIHLRLTDYNDIGHLDWLPMMARLGYVLVR